MIQMKEKCKQYQRRELTFSSWYTYNLLPLLSYGCGRNALMKQSADTSGTLAITYETTQCHNPENNNHNFNGYIKTSNLILPWSVLNFSYGIYLTKSYQNHNMKYQGCQTRRTSPLGEM